MRPLLLCLLAAAVSCSSVSPPSSVTGSWSGQMDNNSSQTYQMSLVQTGSQVTGTAAYIVVTGTADSSVSNIVEIVPVIGSMSGGNLTLTRSCDSCTSFVQFSGHFVNSK